ncbi:MAG: hypothetical protein ABW208_07135 [Pyrinomonadaceae bacterium]
MIYHYRRLAEADPDFDECPEPCAKTREDLRDLCEGCPVQQSFDQYREGCVEEVTERYGGDLFKQWSFVTLHRDLMRAFNSDAAVRGRGYSRGCSALEARLIDVVRNARHKAMRVDRFNREQERKGNS